MNSIENGSTFVHTLMGIFTEGDEKKTVEIINIFHKLYAPNKRLQYCAKIVILPILNMEYSTVMVVFTEYALQHQFILHSLTAHLSHYYNRHCRLKYQHIHSSTNGEFTMCRVQNQMCVVHTSSYFKRSSKDGAIRLIVTMPYHSLEIVT
ncbi:Hypothetical predicted protein [Octopus vulgaris]|uniref:Uncharacterized protein n=1 Tax=Octopus vulgaris TaxID=6645 RepID=A0AA36FDY4_OCTVU|nr:Hypothetical predicted protein [Octopus vulgaris]